MDHGASYRELENKNLDFELVCMEKCIQCDACEGWLHFKCQAASAYVASSGKSKKQWRCAFCSGKTDFSSSD